MRRLAHKFLIFVVAGGLLLSAALVFAHEQDAVDGLFESLVGAGGADDEKRAALDQKSQELEQIQLQVREQQKKLQETQEQSRTLSNEVKSIDTSIKTINLGIKSSEVLIEKLDIEEELLSSDIETAEEAIAHKEAAVGDILRQMQESDVENVLFILLKHKTLSEGIVYTQSLADMNQNLLVTISDLQESKNNLESTLQKTSQTKQAKETERLNLKNKKIIADELRSEKSSVLTKTKQKEGAYQQELKELEQRQLEIALEIEKIEAELRGQIDAGSLPKDLPGILLVPASGAITQEHGATSFAKRAYRGKWHNGLDIGAPVGTPVVAAEDGVVLSVANQDAYCYKGAYGKYVAIKHTIGVTTLYAHLSLYSVSEGQRVKRGEVIGYIGKTGYATGAHLHFGVYDSSTFRIEGSRSCGPKMPVGGDLDPRKYLAL